MSPVSLLPRKDWLLDYSSQPLEPAKALRGNTPRDLFPEPWWPSRLLMTIFGRNALLGLWLPGRLTMLMLRHARLTFILLVRKSLK